MFIDISDKVVVITGASKGLGRLMALAFASEGAKIVINYNSSYNEANKLYKILLSRDCHCILVQADISRNSDVRKLYDETINTFGKVDILINNAGVLSDAPSHDMEEEQWEKVLNVNLTGTYLCSSIFSKIMMNQNFGKIINIASIKGQEGEAYQANYSASKAGVIGLTKSLAKELGDYNVSVNAVCPGYIATDLNKHSNNKKKMAEQRSVLKIDTLANDLISFLIYMSSTHFRGVSGRVFNLDSRLL